MSRGVEQWLLDLAGDPDFALALMRKITDLMKASVIGLLEEAGDTIDVLVTGDDLGSQTATLISPRMYRRMIKPFHAEIYQEIKKRTKAKIFYHSDGNIYPLLGDLVEIGIDLLNPVQVNAGDMGDTARLKREFGDRLSFCGAIDTGWVLPNGTPDRRARRGAPADQGSGTGRRLHPGIGALHPARRAAGERDRDAGRSEDSRAVSAGVVTGGKLESEKPDNPRLNGDCIMQEKENLLRAITRNDPDHVPIRRLDGSIPGMARIIYKDSRALLSGTDRWGVTWAGGVAAANEWDAEIQGYPVNHPLQDLSELEAYPFPDPDEPGSWMA